MFGWLATSTIFGVMMHCEQSRVGKVSESWAMCPPIDGSRSTSTTWWPQSAMSRAAWIPAMPPPMTSAALGDRHADRLQLAVVLHPLDQHVHDVDGLGRRLVAILVHPGAVFADVGHLAEERVEPGLLGGLAEGLLVHARAAGRHHHAVQPVLGDAFFSSDCPGSEHMYL